MDRWSTTATVEQGHAPPPLVDWTVWDVKDWVLLLRQ